MPNTGHITQRPLRGVVMIMIAVLVFACMDSTGKYLAQTVPVPFFLAARYVVNLLLIILVFAPKHGFDLLKTNRTGLVVLRGVALAASSLCAGIALKFMPLPETIAIVYLAPFGVMLLSGPLLNDKVPLSGWIATAIGFIGLLLIVRPSSGLSSTGIIYGLLTIGGTIIYHMLSRSLAKTETTMALLFYTALVGAITFSIFLPWNLPSALPQGLNAALILALGCLSMLGHFLFTAAYRVAPTSLLTPVNYMHLAWGALLGWLVFNHVPDAISMAGIMLVAVAGAGNALWMHFRKSNLA